MRYLPAAALWLTLLVAVAAAYALRAHFNSPAPGIGLRAEKIAHNVHLTWNGRDRLFAGATSGLVSIKDGPYQKFVSLTSSELANGSLSYAMNSDSVEFRLSLALGGGRAVSESLLVLAPPAPTREAPLPEMIYQQPYPNGESSRAAQTPAPRNVFTPPDRGPRLVAESFTLPTPSATQPVTASNNPLSGSDILGVRAQPPPVQAPVEVKPAVKPAEPPDAPNPAPARVATQARAIRRVPAAVPSDVLALLVTPADVDVHVNIDASGRVITAEIAGGRGSIVGLLSPYAVSAARAWVFEPARIGNRAVPSEYLITFRFSPRSK